MTDDPLFGAPVLQPSATPLHDAIDKLGQNGEGFELDAGRDTAGHVGVTAEVDKDLGKGWSVGAAAQWMKDAGWAAWGKVKWTPKSK
jgi:hypothetical protein